MELCRRPHWSKDVHQVYVCAYIYVCVWVKVVGGWSCLLLHLQLWSTVSLRKPLLRWTDVKRHSNQTMRRMGQGWRDEKSILMLIWHFLPSWSNALEGRKEEINEDDDDNYVCQWSNESVFILIEQCCLTEVSFRYSPGKWLCEVCLFTKHSCLY